MSSISPHSQWGSFMMFLRIEFDEEKNNLVVGVYGVYGLVFYRNNIIDVTFYGSIKVVFE